MPVNKAQSICKTIMRNGYDAYVISAALQKELRDLTQKNEIAIACEPDFDTLSKLLPNLEESPHPDVLAILTSEETGVVYRFYSTNAHTCSDPEVCVMRLTDDILQQFKEVNEKQYTALRNASSFVNSDKVFADFGCGCIRLAGLPQMTLRRNYALAIRAIRYAANYELPIDNNTWVSIVQHAHHVANYVSAEIFMEEWRQVSAEAMWRFIELLQESRILGGLIPEIAALSAIKQNKSKNILEEETVFDFTINCMKRYPEDNLHHDWIGVVAVLFHQVGKIYAAEHYEGKWCFFQHHRIGAKIARKRLRHLNFTMEDVETVYNIVDNQVRFQSMMTDRGIHYFLQIPDTTRLIELSRAQIKATPDGNYTNFNHNLKFMKRGNKPLSMLEPLLNGNEIMECTGILPGPNVGLLREALLNAQILGEVQNPEQAVAFVKSLKDKLNF